MKQIKLALTLALGIVPAISIAAEQVTSYAKESGYSACLSTVSEIENFFANDQNYGSWAFLAKENSDDQILNATLELTFTDGAQLIDFTVAPTKDNTCSYVYTRTWYNPKSCMAASKEDFMAKATYKTEINKFTTAFQDSNGAKILLTSVGNGCLIQKKEVGFRHKKQI